MQWNGYEKERERERREDDKRYDWCVKLLKLILKS